MLLETNIKEKKINDQWDFILPLTAIIENFNIFKNFKSEFSKSLFLKTGPQYA
jgi:hypothetical protein